MTVKISDEVKKPTVGLALWWLGNAGFALKYKETLILIDPVIEVKSEDEYTTSETGLKLLHELPLRATDVERADIVLLILLPVLIWTGI
jgi:L-ascorbate metabolism protein UlaG (beta-lactamase superfamily)